MRILIASDGSSAAHNAAHYAAQFARPAAAEVTLLGVVEAGRPVEALTGKLEALRSSLLEGGDLNVKIKVRQGDPVEEIVQESDDHFYQMVVVGSRTRQGIGRLLFGVRARDTSRLLSQLLRVPLLVVSEGYQRIRRVLICTSGQKAGETDARVGGAIAALVNAEVKMVHVMSQIALVPDAPLVDLQEDTAELIRAGTREGRHLKRTLDILEEVGVRPEQRHAEVKNGLVMDEILQEARKGKYDLVVIGAHEVPRERSWRELRELLQENLCDELLAVLKPPVLVVRSLDERDWVNMGAGPAQTRPNRAAQSDPQAPGR